MTDVPDFVVMMMDTGKGSKQSQKANKKSKKKIKSFKNRN